MTAPTPRDPAPTEGRPESHTHCWHRGNTTFTSYPAQWDEVCCHCGAKERRREKLPDVPPGHGPHHPNARGPYTVSYDPR